MSNFASKILVINTGGTITMTSNAEGQLQPGNGEQLTNFIQQLTPDLTADIDILPLTNLQGEELSTEDSSDINPKHWDAMAAMVIRHIDEYDGFVILHGTDTMAYTASALSFCLAQCTKPIVLTGAQVPLSQPGSDGLQNLRLALYVAEQAGIKLPPLNEVSICFAGQLLRGNRARKSSTRSAIGFSTPNAPILGELFPSPRLYSEQLRPPIVKSALTESNLGFSTKVLSMNLTPGIDGALLLQLLTATDLEGLVLRVFGCGTAPETLNLSRVVEEARQRTQGDFKYALVVTDVYSGSLELNRYAAGTNLRSPFILDGMDMTPEAATAKLMWVLGSTERREKLPQLMAESISMEISE